MAGEQSGGFEKMTENLTELLCSSLNSQLLVYKKIYDLQNELLKNIDATNELDKIMDLLNQKSSLLDSIRAENSRSAPLVEEFVERKEELKNHPLHADIERIISEIEKFVLELRAQDEAMITRFDQHSQSKNRIDAFRALR
jgi:nitrogen-specific signal transduction histidine kinase